MRPIDADALMGKIKGHYDLYETSRREEDIARRDELSAVMADILNAPTLEMRVDSICGYPVENLALFAHACRQEGVAVEDLRDFATNVEGITRMLQKDIQKQFEDHIERVMNQTDCAWK